MKVVFVTDEQLKKLEALDFDGDGMQPAMGLSRGKNTERVNRQKGKKGVENRAHPGWAG